MVATSVYELMNCTTMDQFKCIGNNTGTSTHQSNVLSSMKGSETEALSTDQGEGVSRTGALRVRTTLMLVLVQVVFEDIVIVGYQLGAHCVTGMSGYDCDHQVKSGQICERQRGQP